MPTEPFIRTEFELSATINGIEFRDIVSISASFGLNMIPTATLTVAAGREVRTGDAATIHNEINNLKPRSEAIVRLRINSTEGRREDPIISGMRAGVYTIFRGYFAGIGYQRAHNNAVYTVHLIHWLDDLNCSSILNGNWFPGVPHDLAQAASFHALNRLGGAGDRQSYVSTVPMIDESTNTAIVTKENMEGDLWLRVIKKVFVQLAKTMHPNSQCEEQQVLDEETAKTRLDTNGAALNALDRIPGVGAPFAKPLQLDLGEWDQFLAEHCAREGLTHMLIDGLGYNTFWSKLVGQIGPSFLFAISPGVDFALPVPFFPGLSRPYTTITGEEYNYANFNSNVAHLIESINIFYAPQSSTGLFAGGVVPPIISYCDPWGSYPKDANDKDFRGNILVREPPSWLANPAYMSYWTPGTTMPAPAGSTTSPQKGDDVNPGGPKRPQDAEQNLKDSTILDRYAEHWFKSAVLGQRHGELSGKFRLDIAPGSTVKIDPPDTAIGGEATAMFASVVQVAFVINSEQHTAGTSFTLSNLRTAAENSNGGPMRGRFTAPNPPLYSEAATWSGGPLVVGQEPAGQTPTINLGPPEFRGPGGFRSFT